VQTPRPGLILAASGAGGTLGGTTPLPWQSPARTWIELGNAAHRRLAQQGWRLWASPPGGASHPLSWVNLQGNSSFDTAEGCAPGLSRIAPWQGLTRGELAAWSGAITPALPVFTALGQRKSPLAWRGRSGCVPSLRRKASV